ncbi:hypothetical protein F4778DRAFT_718549 [Xylariomycetidae sp. FL2044]|nr:hypothetical protein F4778DRAFT_718549 [Xylariomycetidae sp. FL2044]
MFNQTSFPHEQSPSFLFQDSRKMASVARDPRASQPRHTVTIKPFVQLYDENNQETEDSHVGDLPEYDPYISHFSRYVRACEIAQTLCNEIMVPYLTERFLQVIKGPSNNISLSTAVKCVLHSNSDVDQEVLQVSRTCDDADPAKFTAHVHVHVNWTSAPPEERNDQLRELWVAQGIIEACVPVILLKWLGGRENTLSAEKRPAIEESGRSAIERMFKGTLHFVRIPGLPRHIKTTKYLPMSAWVVRKKQDNGQSSSVCFRLNGEWIKGLHKELTDLGEYKHHHGLRMPLETAARAAHKLDIDENPGCQIEIMAQPQPPPPQPSPPQPPPRGNDSDDG